MLDVLHVIEWIRELFAWWEAWMFVVCRMPMTLLWRVCAENIFDSIFGYHPQNTHMHKRQKVEFASELVRAPKLRMLHVVKLESRYFFSPSLKRNGFWPRSGVPSSYCCCAMKRVSIFWFHPLQWNKKKHIFSARFISIEFVRAMSIKLISNISSKWISTYNCFFLLHLCERIQENEKYGLFARNLV